MRKLIILAALIISSARVCAQQPLKDSLKNLSPAELGNYHLQKSKENRTGAIVLAGLGLGTMIIGGTIINNSGTTIFDDKFDEELNALMTVTVVGSALVICSIPLAISSFSHKQKANDLLGNTKKKKTLSLNLKSSKIPNGYAQHSIPLKSIGLNFNF